VRFLRVGTAGLGASSLGIAAACCLGGSSKSFLSLQRLQKYEVGTALSYKEDYGRFSAAGSLESSEVHRTFQMVLGAGTRVHPDWQLHAFVPLVSQVKSYGSRLENAFGLGDVSVGVDWTAVEALFTTDWYPTIRVQAGLKLPTGGTEKKVSGTWQPGTGNGMWEPYLGVGFEKKIGQFTAGVRGGVTARASSGDKLGTQLELAESLAYNFSPRFSVAAGSSQTWTGDTTVGNRTIASSSSRSISFFAQGTYFIDRTLSVALSAEFTAPQSGWSRNSPATQSISLITKYGLF